MSPKKTLNTRDKVADALAYVVLFIIVLLPFHAFFTTWLGANFGHVDVFRVWKEVLTIIIGGFTLSLVAKDKKLRKSFSSNFLTKLMIVYLLFTLLRATYGWAAGNVNIQATAYALVINLRYIVFFGVVWLIAQKSDLLRRYWTKALLIPAALVVAFGLVQQFVLDKNFLSHFGYSQFTIPPYQAVDLKPEYARAQSTLRGPNPLGAYLSLVITACTGLLYGIRRHQVFLAGLLASSMVLLFFSYSRSAWIGTVLSLVVLALILIRNPKVRSVSLLAITVITLLAGASILALQDNNFVQNTIFHTDETSSSVESSNTVRTNALKNNFADALKHPLGEGPGSAGPASVRNSSPPKIAENYYIQISQELGLLGLLMLLIINLVVAWELWRRRDYTLAAILLASLVGITAVNMVSHAWTDDTLSMLWWGLAGICLAGVPHEPGNAILKANTHEKPKQNKALASRT